MQPNKNWNKFKLNVAFLTYKLCSTNNKFTHVSNVGHPMDMQC
jgi:hypothetical protein